MNKKLNLNLLLDAIGEIDDAFIVSAQNRAALLPGDVPVSASDASDGPDVSDIPDAADNSDASDIPDATDYSNVSDAPFVRFSRFRSAPHRAALTAAAIVILLLSSFTAAMAANEDFRNAVFRFFRISTPDVVLPIEDEPRPSGSDSLDSTSSGSAFLDSASLGSASSDDASLDNASDDSGQSGSADRTDIAEIENIGSTNTGDAVSVEYIRIDGIFDYCDGAIYLYEPWEGYDDAYDAQTRYAAAAYTQEDGQMVLLEPHYETVSYPQDNAAQDTAAQSNSSQGSTSQDNASQGKSAQNNTAQSGAMQDSEATSQDNESMPQYSEAPGDQKLQNGKTTGDETMGDRAADSEVSGGGTWQISFDWYEKNGVLYTNARNYDPAASMEWSVSAVRDSSAFLILTLGFGQQIEYTQYPLLYNVRTKELLDVLARCRLPEGQRITHTAFSPNLSRILITCDNGAAVYCYDIAEENLVSLSEASGLDEPEASFLDDDTVCCLSIDENGLYQCRTIEMPSGECSERFSDLPRLEGDSHSGIALAGGRYGLYVNEDRSVLVYDFKTGDYAAVEDFQYPEDDVFLTMNPAEDKILFIQETPEADGLGISQLGVLNLASRTFVLLDREGYETRRETSVGWFDNDRVAIRADAKGVGYLYLYTVNPLPVN